MIRYYPWKYGQILSEKSELVLKGVRESQSSQGGDVYTFKLGAFTYTVHNLNLCESVSKSLIVSKNMRVVVDQAYKSE